MSENKKSVGIIGFGRFGELVASHLKKYFTVCVSDSADKEERAARLGVQFTSFEACAGKDIVVLCVPISAFENVLEEIYPVLKSDALLCDVCSVKEEPVQAMQKMVPKRCECVGMHPLFGPDSAKHGIHGKKIVLCPVRTGRLESVTNFLQHLGLHVEIVSPEEHDRQMAQSLALLHFLGTAVSDIQTGEISLTPPTYELFTELLDRIKHDGNQLLRDMHLHNRFAPETRKELIERLIEIDHELAKDNRIH